MNKFISLIQALIDQKIDFKNFDKEWQKLYLDSGEYEKLSDSEKDFVDEIHDKEDYVTEDQEELKELKKYNFISVENFLEWLKEVKKKNIIFWN